MFFSGLYPSASHFFVCAGILILVANVGASFGYMMSCFSSDPQIVMAAATPFIIPMMLFGGLLLNVESIPVYFIWLEYLSWFKYGNEALNINQWKDVTEISCDAKMSANFTYGNETGQLCIHNGTVVLQQFNFDEDNMYFDVGLLFVLMVGYRLLGFIILAFRTRKKA